jgi:hypothetical protein
MSVASGPNVVANGLIFEYDMSNTARSWKGMPITNVLVDTGDLSTGNWAYTLFGNWPATGASVNSGLDPNGKPTATRVSATGYSRFQRYAVSANVTYTFSLWVKNISMIASVALRIATGLNGTLVAYSYATYISLSSDWTRYSVSVTIPASGVNQIEAGIDVSSNYPNGAVYCDVWQPQLEVNTFASPFILGTRSATQALLDLTNNNTLTATSLTYASDNTFSFNGTSDRIDSVFKPPATARSFFIWIYFNTLTTVGGYQIMGTQEVGAYTYIGIINGGNIYYYGGASGGDIGNPVAATTWINLGLVINSDGSRSIYKNGVAVYSTSGSVGNTPTLNFQIGMLNNSYALNGKCPVTHVYNRALSADEVTQNFNALRGRYGI